MLYALIIAAQNRQRPRHAEAGFSSIPRIEKQRAIDDFAEWLMRMPEYNHIRTLPPEARLKSG